MTLHLSHMSALEFWRSHCYENPDAVFVKCSVGLPKNPALVSLPANVLDRLSTPVHITVGCGNARKYANNIVCHVQSGTLPPGCFYVAENKLYVSSPELMFVQMAKFMSLPHLIQLGFEICGTYSLFATNGSRSSSDNTAESGSDKGFYNRKPLTTKNKLESRIEQFKGLRGAKLASRAAKYVLDGSASPMETILAMLLCLPVMLGGYGFPAPEMNKYITPIKSVRQMTGKRCLSCDLYWPKHNLAVEYDSNQFHTGATRIAADSRRRNILQALGIQTITVTNEQIKSSSQFAHVAKQIQKTQGVKLRTSICEIKKRNAKLRQILLTGHSDAATSPISTQYSRG